MPLDVLGRTRATLTGPTSSSPWPKGLGNLVKPCRAGDRALQLLIFNEECLVSASHQLALITSLPFVHTARRSYRLDVLVKRLDWRQPAVTLTVAEKFVKPSHLEEGEVVTRFPFAAPCRSLSRPKG